MSDLTVYRHEYPVSAVQYMADRDLQGNVVVAFDWAQYVLAALGTSDAGKPGVRVAVDGRYRTSYPQPIIDMHFDFAMGNLGPMYRHRAAESGRFDPSKVLSYGREPYGSPNLVLINTWQPHALQMMQQHKEEWVLLYRDNIAQLWGRATIYDDPTRVEYIPPAHRQLTIVPQVGSVTWPALPIRSQTTSMAAR